MKSRRGAARADLGIIWIHVARTKVQVNYEMFFIESEKNRLKEEKKGGGGYTPSGD